MSTSIDQAFVKQFEKEVHLAYQRKGSKLRGTVRNVNNVVGSSTTFQKVGKGSAGTKSTHGLVPVMNLVHGNVTCNLEDFYAGDWVDKLHEKKVNHDERAVISDNGAAALGRKTDDLIIDSLASVVDAGQIISANNMGITLAKCLEAVEIAGKNDVFEEGEMFGVVGWRQWTELLKIEEFASADYVGGSDLPFTMSMGQRPKFWMGAYWLPHSELDDRADDDDISRCYFYSKKAVGHASGADVSSDITWHGERASHFVNNMMSQGSVLIDGLGVVVIECDRSPT